MEKKKLGIVLHNDFLCPRGWQAKESKRECDKITKMTLLTKFQPKKWKKKNKDAQAERELGSSAHDRTQSRVIAVEKPPQTTPTVVSSWAPAVSVNQWQKCIDPCEPERERRILCNSTIISSIVIVKISPSFLSIPLFSLKILIFIVCPATYINPIRPTLSMNCLHGLTPWGFIHVSVNMSDVSLNYYILIQIIKQRFLPLFKYQNF